MKALNALLSSAASMLLDIEVVLGGRALRGASRFFGDFFFKAVERVLVDAQS